ncbi:hypothetical protein ACLB2K_075668 [Fragaria x ananassa]
MLPSINMPGAAVFQNPAQPLIVLHAAPEIDAEPQPKKLCAPPPEVDEAKASYYCRLCDKEDDPDSEDDLYPGIGEYKGYQEGFVWTCLLGCSGRSCKFDHGNGITYGQYVPMICDRCDELGHWTSECSIKPKFAAFAEELEGAADADTGEIDNTST